MVSVTHLEADQARRKAMLNPILVPIDGSDASEKAIPVASQIARAQNAEVILVRVIEPYIWDAHTTEAPMDPETYDTLIRAVEDQAQSDLTRLQESLTAQAVNARGIALQGFPASQLLDLEQAEHPDLIVMATHGRTGLARFALGSVADRLVREGTVPVLLVRRSTAVDAKLQTAVVMLDGSGVAEQALPLVDELVGKPLQSVTLFRSVSDPADREAARTYLTAVAGRMAGLSGGVRVVVDVGDPRHTIERVARDHDLVILCTHGEGGLDRLRHGSVAEAVVRNVDNPVLLVRASA
jgi:nucleotide-binding universal stress UspA family protein